MGPFRSSPLVHRRFPDFRLPGVGPDGVSDDLCEPYGKRGHHPDSERGTWPRIAQECPIVPPIHLPIAALSWLHGLALTVPWVTYTDPEIAHVGLYEKEAEQQGIPVKTFVQELRDVDRAVLDGETEGFVKVHVKAGTDRILGATVVARHAGEMLSEITLAMVGGLGLGTIANTIHPYPTQAEAIKRVGDAYNRSRLTPFVKKLFSRWLSWTR